MEQKTAEKIILNTSDEAAKFVENISGWVSRDGMFFGNSEQAERIARYAGCTHTECEDCKSPAPKGRTVCGACSKKRDIARYEKREKQEWNQEGLLYSDWADRYFSSWDEIADYGEEHGVAMADMRLIICEPVFLRSIDEDHWSDDLPEDTDGELPEEVFKALNELNEALKKAGPVSWMPGKIAAIV